MMAVQLGRLNRLVGDRLQEKPEEEVEVYVLFVNTTNRTLDLYWVRDPETERIQFTLKPNTAVPVNTYNTHRWFFRDYHTGETMHVRSKRYFFPARMRMPRDPQRPQELVDVRTQILIHFPLRTLKENCLWLIVRWLMRTSDTPRSCINNFNIPVTLRQQLLQLISSIESYWSRAQIHRQRRVSRQ